MVVNASRERTSLQKQLLESNSPLDLHFQMPCKQGNDVLLPRLSRRFDFKIALEDIYSSPFRSKKSSFASLADRNSIFRCGATAH